MHVQVTDDHAVIVTDGEATVVMAGGLTKRQAARMRRRINRAARVSTLAPVKWDGRTSTYRPVVAA